MHISLKPNKIYQSKQRTVIVKTKKIDGVRAKVVGFLFRKRIQNGEYSDDFIFAIPKSGLRIRIHFIRIRIQFQHFRLNTDPDPDPIRIRIQSGSRALMTKD